MYSGFVSHNRVISSIGIHQRFDTAAYKAINHYLAPGGFPTLAQILEFEGMGGPDGLKVKSPGEHEPSHLYDPDNDTGEVPTHIENHYRQLVEALTKDDMIRASFEAGWLAHYVTDGLTPAHHFPLEDKLAELGVEQADLDAKSRKQRVARARALPVGDNFRKNWAIWGRKGLLSTHLNFELGVASALLILPIRTTLDDTRLASARKLGAVEYFKTEAREVAELKLYDRFYAEGWTSSIATAVRKEIAPRTARAVAAIWLLAYLDSGHKLLTGQTFEDNKQASA